MMAGGQLFGFIGILIALPIAALIMVFLRHLHLGYKQSSLYDSARVLDISVEEAVQTKHDTDS
ncbi:MAG: putative PurR-regulated permease PerM [Oceanospirillaceae bacterium]